MTRVTTGSMQSTQKRLAPESAHTGPQSLELPARSAKIAAHGFVSFRIRPLRVDRFTYAIRNIVAEAQKVEAAGTTVRYLNIGDPESFRLPHAAAPRRGGRRAMRDGHNGYTPSPGIVEAREAVAAEFPPAASPCRPTACSSHRARPKASSWR